MTKNGYQPMPCEGVLARNLNLSREVLLERIAPFLEEKTFSYIVASVEWHDGVLCQTATAPNFQGDVISLCTCKHQDRTRSAMKSGEIQWIAGYTSSTLPCGSKLFYLIRVAYRFESQQEMWFSDSIPDETKKAKAADEQNFGDFYRPKGWSGDPYDPENYFQPCASHDHCGDWHADVDYLRYGRRPAILVGDPDYSFLWDEPVIPSPFKPQRALKGTTLRGLFSSASRPCPSLMTVEAGN